MSILKKFSDRFFGLGSASTTVPLMDGALHPNRALDEAEQVVDLPDVDDLAMNSDGTIIASARDQLFVIGANKVELLQTFDKPITALAVAENGNIAVALGGDGIQLVSEGKTVWSSGDIAGLSLTCVTALVFGENGDLLVCNASSQNDLANWRIDFLSSGKSGTVYRIGADGKTASTLATNLSYPNGILESKGVVYISESWKHRVIGIDSQSGVIKISSPVLPAYPSRLKIGEDGLICLSCFAPRSQLFELVLRHKGYRSRMMAELPQNSWIGPSLGRGRTYLDPLQGGAIKQMGMMKPWAPSASYGLVAFLDADLAPVASFHSRADGHFHGTTSAISDRNGRLFVASFGAGKVLILPELEGKT
jgi:hypothetical protein